MAGFETYPGLRAKMGEKDKELVYYMIKMRARDLVGKVVTAKEIEKNSNPVVDEMVQRSIRGNRSMGAIADYLSSAHNNGERFMGSFVIATFGGNPLAMRAGLTTLDVIEEERLLENARNRGNQILKRLKSELKIYPDVASIRGIGLMIGIQLKVECSQITKIALDNGLLVNVTNSRVIRLLPPLIISHKEVEILLAKLVVSIKTFFEK